MNNKLISRIVNKRFMIALLPLTFFAGIVTDAKATPELQQYYGAPSCFTCHTRGAYSRPEGQAGLTAFLASLTPTCTPPQVLENNQCVTPAPTVNDSDRLFAYLEATYPEYLSPAGSASTNFAGYYYRYYPDTNAYVATANDTVYYLGPVSNNAIIPLGSLADWLAQATAAGY